MTQPSRQKAPAPLAPAPFNISKPFVTTLDNGLMIVVVDDKRLPLVSYRLAFLTGDADDPQGNVGLTSAMASMMTEGTLNYSSRELAEKIERLGANVGVNSSDDFTIVSASSLSIYSTDILQLMDEIVFRPIFPETELDLYKRNAVENLKFQRSQANFLANEQTARILYGEHPYARISPSVDDIEKLNRDLLVTFHAQQLAPNNAIFVAIGDVDRDELLKDIEEHFSAWEPAQRADIVFPDPPSRRSRTMTLVDRPGSAQSNIILSNLALPRKHPDYFAVTVMNQVLGAGASSRVFMNLREEKGYTYGAYTRLDTKLHSGEFEATAEVRTPVTGDSLREFFYELERIRDERVGDQELIDAKNFLTGVFPIRAETQEGLTNLIVTQQLYDLPEDYLQTYREKIEAVTADEVQEAAVKYIKPDELAIVIVGDVGEVLGQVRSYADDIEIFDTEKNPLSLSSFEQSEGGEAADVSGDWELTLDFQGQRVPVKLSLQQQDGSLTGSIETALGSGKIESGKVNGNRLNATASTEIQGQSVDFVIVGAVEGEVMQGSLSTAIIPDSLSFEGKRAA